MRDFEEIPPFEGELHDHAVSSPSVNITVMSSSLFLLSQIFSRTGGALIGVNGTRLHREAAEAPCRGGARRKGEELLISRALHILPSQNPVNSHVIYR